MRKVLAVHDAAPQHWVGDGFPVRSVFSYDGLGREPLSPFLLLDFAAPRHFDPAPRRRGVGVHPHRGFETVTIVYAGELEHRDSAGNGGSIGPGDVQWMTAASGILHEEFHSERFTREGGLMSMMQLWVNLPARHKMAKPRYQTILDASIPRVPVGDGAGTLRVIAGEYEGTRGPAETFTPIEVWDLRIADGKSVTLRTPEGHTTAVVPMQGRAILNGEQAVETAQIARLARGGGEFTIAADGELSALVLGGEPIAEPVVGYGPFVMNSEREIAAAFADFQSGRFGRM
jgi:redox-sensitive bicupin YhaK (pirin superfamily)